MQNAKFKMQTSFGNYKRARQRRYDSAALSICILHFAFELLPAYFFGVFTGSGGAVWQGVGRKFASLGSSRKFVLV